MFDFLIKKGLMISEDFIGENPIAMYDYDHTKINYVVDTKTTISLIRMGRRVQIPIILENKNNNYNYFLAILDSINHCSPQTGKILASLCHGPVKKEDGDVFYDPEIPKGKTFHIKEGFKSYYVKHLDKVGFGVTINMHFAKMLD